MKRILNSIILILIAISFQAQTIDMNLLKGMNVRNIGPAGMSGRVTAIDVNLSNDQHIIIGAASGGVWESHDGGTTWKPIFENEATMSIGAIKFNQNNPSEIWVGTGEGNPRNSHNSGRGIYKSIDGGKTWKCMGLEDTKLIHRVYIHDDDSNTIYVGTLGSAWGPSQDRGFYKTTDGGATWKKTLYINDETGIADMVVDPSNPNKILAATWEFGRKPWTFNSGGEGSGLHLSYDGGETWKQITHKEGLPKGQLGRMGIAIAPSKPNIIYALIEAKKNGLYKSTDGGEKWKLVSTENIGNRPFYYAEIYVDPHNENRIFNLWSYVSKSEDGGKTFETIMDYGNNVHPDHHAFWIHPDNPNYIIDGNDGGLNISRDGGANWDFIANIPIGQFYHVNVDRDFPYNVYGGMQDNGSWVGPGFVLKRGGIRNYDWQELYFGDGFDVLPKPFDNRYGYAMSQGGNVAMYDRQTGRTQAIKPVHPDGEELRFHWNAPIAQDYYSDCGIYFGSQYVHKSDDCGQSWEIISPDLTTNDTTKQKQHLSGGLTIDDTEAENHTTILCIAPSVLNEDVLWVGTDDGNVQLTTDGGKTWKLVSNRMPDMPKNAWIPQIEVSKVNKGEAFVVVNNYRQNDWSAYLYHTTNYGQSWKRIVNDLDVDGFVNAVVQDPSSPNLMFLGTDVGLYVSFDAGKKWTKWNDEFPSVQIRDMVIQEDFQDLVIGTFGRAFWVIDDIRPLQELAKNPSFLDSDFAILPSGEGYLTSMRSYDGIRFIAQGEFVGDNRSTGLVLNVFKKKKEKQAETETKEKDKKEDKKPKEDKVFITVFAENGDTIRNFSQKLTEDGLNRIRWGMTANGTKFPSRSEDKKDADPPGGTLILPGKYMVKMKYMEETDSTWVNIKPDPRIEYNEDDLVAKKQMIDSYENNVERATQAFNKIKKAKKAVSLVDKMMVNMPDSTQTEIKDWNKDITKKLKELEELYFMEEGLKGIQRDPKKLASRLRAPSWYMRSAWGVPGQNAQNLKNLTQKETDRVVGLVNEFFEGDWKAYQDKVNALKFSFFEE